jgi:uncharacterized Zn-binding protein involved in type VI secretion
MGLPAARKDDDVAHKDGAGAVLEGCPTVRINGLPAARLGDKVQHNKGIETITTGEPTVRIGGPIAARITDKVGCGGFIAVGSPNVRIGRDTEESCLASAAESGAMMVTAADSVGI